MEQDFIDLIFKTNSTNFNEQVLKIYNFQKENCLVFREWLNFNKKLNIEINSYLEIPFLPIQLYKNKKVLNQQISTKDYFLSSGTTQQNRSTHWIGDFSIYQKSIEKCFTVFFGQIQEWCIIGLLPSYSENSASSLIYMTDFLMRKSANACNGYYLNNYKDLIINIENCKANNQKVWLIGVSFALLDFANQYSLDYSDLTVINTGGMKGRGKELTNIEVQSILQNSFPNSTIQGEYSMTELFSQAYSDKQGRFKCPPWMKVVIAEIDDPSKICPHGKGIICIIDLANIHTCSFIATEDIGEVYEDGTFIVLGRKDNADLRGCNMLLDALF